uniref:RING-type domain-containing protein n=1 Tax=Guillardia theta TaxID=55529 RepID=A0A7S4NB47_GUITH|mmetsp:Transcript_1943/g.5839  ORF Transcript_1943/g.5839 Transcript_1943/m.5839 type:complete len:280 (+) Transcript_1943:97-936(+)
MWEDVEVALSACSFCQDSSPTIRLLIAPCGHTLCEPCCGSAFRANKVLECKGCSSPFSFRKEELVPTHGEDPFVRREIKIRHKVLSVYNRQEEDFRSSDVTPAEAKKLYNAYLEEVESIIDRLVNKVDLDELEAQLAEHSQNNRDAIVRNQGIKKKLESSFGVAPLDWQIAPGKPLFVSEKKTNHKPDKHVKSAAPTAVPPPARHHAEKLQQKILQQQGVQAQQAPAEAPPAEKIARKEPREPAAALKAGGFSDSFQQDREQRAALLGLQRALLRYCTP